MSLLKQAVRLNNQGVQCLMLGKYIDSIEVFFRAIKVLQAELDAIDIIEQPSPSVHEIQPTRPFSRPISFKMLSLANIQVSIKDDNRYSKNQQEEDAFIFSQAFEIPEIPEGHDEQAVSPTDVSVYSAQVLFNLALAHHLLYIKVGIGSVDGSSIDENQFRNHGQKPNGHNKNHRSMQAPYEQRNQQQGLLRKAEGLYNAALNILDEESCQVHTNCTCWIIQLASNTNWLQLVRSSRYTDGIVEYPINYHRTCEALRYLSTYHDEIFEDPRLEGLFYHVLLFKGPTLAPAA